MSLELLKETLLKCPIVDKGGYQYFVHPITDGIPRIDPELIGEVTDEMAAMLDDKDFDYIVGAEAMAIPIGIALAMKIKKPFVVVRKRKYGLEGEREVLQQTGYSKTSLYINGLKAGDRVVIVDDVISTGGTLKALCLALKDMGVVIRDIIIVIEKGYNKKAIEDAIGMNIRTLVHVDVVDGKLKILG